MTKSLVKRLTNNETLLGSWCAIPSSVTAEIMARTGFDFVVMDMQHGLLDFSSTVSALQAVDITDTAPVVRVSWNDPAEIGKVLDAGAMTIIAPMTNTVADAEAAVSACRYAPEGIRSFGPMRVGLREGANYPGRANSDVAVFPMIETEEALNNVEAIAAVAGVTGLFVGPFDLSLSLGLPPGNNDGNSKFDKALERILSACKSNNISAGILSNEALAAKRVKQGFQFVVVSTDFVALAGSLYAGLEKVQSELQGEKSENDSPKGYGS